MDREVTRLCTSRDINALLNRERGDSLAVSTFGIMNHFPVVLTTFGSVLVTEWDFIDPFDTIIVDGSSVGSEK